MKVMLLTTHFNCGGITSYTVSLARILAQQGIKVSVVSSGGDMLPLLKQYNIEHIHADVMTKSELHPKIVPAIIKVANVAREKGIDIIHSQTRVTQVIGSLAARLAKARYVSTCHGFFKVKWSRRLFPGWGERVFAISDAVREHLVNDFKIKKEKVRLVNNGVDINKFARDFDAGKIKHLRETFGLNAAATFVVGSIARLSSVKGHKYLIEAAAIILSKVKGVYFLIIGDGDEKYNLIHQARELKIEKNIIFLPSVTDTLEPLKIMQVFVLPSIQEGLGLAAMEASAAGVAVVASDVGGIYSVVKDNATGFLVPMGDAPALAEKIIILLNDQSLRERFAANGKDFMRENFSLEQMGEKVIGVYKELLHE